MNSDDLPPSKEPFLHPASLVHDSARIGDGCYVWPFAQIRENVTVGDNSVVGQAAYLGPGVIVGPKCRIQNSAMLYEPAALEEGVFIGPGVILTNDRLPRALNLDGSPKSALDWSPAGVRIERGSSVGANAVLIGPIVLGRYSMVAAGAVVTRDVAPHSLVQGVPACHVAWVGRGGHRLVPEAGRLVCPASGETYLEEKGHLRILEA